VERKARRAVLPAVVGQDALELPAGRLQLGGDATGELRGLVAGRVAARTGHELCPGEGGGDVDRGQLPDSALRAGEAADVEGVKADELARPLGLDMALRLRIARLVRGGVTGDEREPLSRAW
jgi:hypothetical protein